jgi:hypothetical protein
MQLPEGLGTQRLVSIHLGAQEPSPELLKSAFSLYESDKAIGVRASQAATPMLGNPSLPPNDNHPPPRSKVRRYGVIVLAISLASMLTVAMVLFL